MKNKLWITYKLREYKIGKIIFQDSCYAEYEVESRDKEIYILKVLDFSNLSENERKYHEKEIEAKLQFLENPNDSEMIPMVYKCFFKKKNDKIESVYLLTKKLDSAERVLRLDELVKLGKDVVVSLQKLHAVGIDLEVKLSDIKCANGKYFIDIWKVGKSDKKEYILRFGHVLQILYERLPMREKASECAEMFRKVLEYATNTDIDFRYEDLGVFQQHLSMVMRYKTTSEELSDCTFISSKKRYIYMNAKPKTIDYIRAALLTVQARVSCKVKGGSIEQMAGNEYSITIGEKTCVVREIFKAFELIDMSNVIYIYYGNNDKAIAKKFSESIHIEAIIVIPT